MFVFYNIFSYICYMKIYKFAKWIWCWDITIGSEPYCYVMAENEEDAIKINNTTEGRHYDTRLDIIEEVDEVPEEYINLLTK